ncbi:acyltransferase family protein [Sphingomonas sp. AR_OL41]|uniref:acyltransferase family protein n=1 Tax=Sphingomonas sp. AR_OL41 TaxID=3042729 RepID=UPI0024804208|nr:acyltransferase family protein [Sphingomonas sp. AR_OL41]MDH7974780.1 acyltransferase family protein [Sphingomonas sp. AR_OL41]
MLERLGAVDIDGRDASRDRHIDGLRAVAVGMVLAAHCGVRGTGGGFVGVDVFYVISGFLITRLLLDEQARSGRIDLVAFFARRARRLVPALMVMLLAVLAAGFVLLLPDEQSFLAQTSFSALAFAANVHFVALAQDYFAPRSALSPLQHLWTLGVEAQFYLIWPLILIALKKICDGRRLGRVDPVVLMLAIVIAASLAASIVLTPRDPVGSFYLLPTRAWELALGGLLSRAGPIPSRWAAAMLAMGLAALLAATILFRGLVLYPSYFALLPVAGAAMLILGGRSAPRSPAARALGSAPMVYLGQRSYGLYLWHWPLLAFARIWWAGQVSAVTTALLMAAALGLAIASWRWVEKPIIARRGLAQMSDRATIAVTVGVLLLCVLPAVGLLRWSGRALPPNSIIAQYNVGRLAQKRDFPFCGRDGQGPRCVLGKHDAARSVLLYGDSHASQLSYGIDAAAQSAGARIVVRTMAACAPTGFDVGQTARRATRDACDRFNAGVLADLPALRRSEGIVGVIVAGDWTHSDKGWGDQLERVVAVIRRSGLRVVVAQDTPAQPTNYIRREVSLSGRGAKLPVAEVYEQRRREAETIFLIAQQEGVRIWTPIPALCENGICPVQVGGKLLYRNATHLSVFGSEKLAPALVAPVRWAASLPDQPRIPTAWVSTKP